MAKEIFPRDQKTVIVKVPEKGELQECENWRKIRLLSIVGKAFYRIILNSTVNIVNLEINKDTERAVPEQI